MARPKKIKLVELKQTHGKEETLRPTSLDQIWGSDDNARFGTTNETEFENKLKEMTRADLENIARKHGSIIVESSERIRSELMKIFRQYVSLLRKPSDPRPSKSKISSTVQKILNEGR